MRNPAAAPLTSSDLACDRRAVVTSRSGVFNSSRSFSSSVSEGVDLGYQPQPL